MSSYVRLHNHLCYNFRPPCPFLFNYPNNVFVDSKVYVSNFPVSCRYLKYFLSRKAYFLLLLFVWPSELILTFGIAVQSEIRVGAMGIVICFQLRCSFHQTVVYNKLTWLCQLFGQQQRFVNMHEREFEREVVPRSSEYFMNWIMYHCG
jgi:hypothetical protein